MRVLALDIDGTLIDTRRSFYRIIEELSGATLADITKLKATGAFNDDWELARAAASWIDAGRPTLPSPIASWRDVVALCGHDPGDLSGVGIALYRGGYWRDEEVLVRSGLLHELASTWRVVACTGRDRWELARAQELLSFEFHSAATAEGPRKPDPEALLTLLPKGCDEAVLVGDTEADRLTVAAARAKTSVPLRFFGVRCAFTEARQISDVLASFL